MNSALITLAALVALCLAVLALRRLWRAFIRTTDREIDAAMKDYRRRGFFRNNPRGGRP